MELEGVPTYVMENNNLKPQHSESSPSNNNNNTSSTKPVKKQQQQRSSSKNSNNNNSSSTKNHHHQAAEIIKSSLRGYFKRAQQLLHIKRFHEALIVLSKGANLRPSDSAYVLLNVLRSDAYAGLLDFGSAVSCLRAALISTKHDSEINALRSRLAFLLDTAAISFLQKNEPEKAHALIEEAVELDGGATLEILLHRCFCLIALQRLDDASNELAGLRFVAETLFNESVALECVVLSVSLGIVQKRFEDAKHFLEMTLKRADPAEETNAMMMAGMGGGGGGGGMFGGNGNGISGIREKQSWADHPRIIELEREFDAAFSQFIYEAKATSDVQSLTSGIHCFPNDPELYRARAEALVEKGLFAQGIQDYFQTIEKNSGKDDAAEKAVSKTLFSVAKQLVFGSGGGASTTTAAKKRTEDLQSAVTYLTESHKWNPTDVEVIVMRGDCLFELGENEAAIGDFQRAQTLDSENHQIRQRISDLHNIWGSHLFSQKKFDAAEAEFTKAIEISPFEPRYFYLRAQCRLLSAKSPDDHLLGVRDLIECRKLGTTDPEILLMISQMCPDDRVSEASQDEVLERQQHEAFVARQQQIKNQVFELYNSNSNHNKRSFSSSSALSLSFRRHRGSVSTEDGEEILGLRGNRAELLSSPIDSRKLREATASVTDPKIFAKQFAPPAQKNNNIDNNKNNNQNNGTKTEKDPFWLKKGVVTTLQVKNRMERHEFTSTSSKSKSNSLPPPLPPAPTVKKPSSLFAQLLQAREEEEQYSSQQQQHPSARIKKGPTSPPPPPHLVQATVKNRQLQQTLLPPIHGVNVL